MAQYSSERFAKDFPELSSKYTKLLEAQRSLKGLDPKTRQLINIGIQTANRSLKGVKYHAPMAKKAGATRDEVLGAVVLNLHVCGLGAVLDTLPAAIEGFEGKR
ncbi:MAG: carboxymuconolactone decarboxylase family protein [Nitrososphaerales archaeon]|jgi:AhpD family alkylhydroperoxidase